MTEDGYELIVACPAARAIAETLPEAVSTAVIDFITGISTGMGALEMRRLSSATIGSRVG